MPLSRSLSEWIRNKFDDKCSSISCFKMKMSALDVISCFIGEFIGAGLLVFLSCMGCVSTETWLNNHLQMSLNSGLVVMIIIQSFGCVSGAHLNPAVTLAAFIYNLVSLPMAGVYVIAQCLGATTGYGLLKVLLTQEAITPKGAAHGLCVTVVHPDLTIWQGFGIECIATGVLILVCCGVWDPRNAKYQDSVAIRFGLTMAVMGITMGPFTGGSLNPARSFGPAVWNNDLSELWIYWIGPLTGSCIVALLYKTVLRREVEDEKSNNKLRAMEELPLS